MLLLYDRKRAYMLIGIIAFIVLLTIGISYAYNSQQEEKIYTTDSDGLITTFTYPPEELSEPLELISDETHINSPEYSFTIKNTTSEEQYYNILITLNNQIEPALLPYIKIVIDDENYVYLTANSQESPYNVYLGSISSKVAITHKIKVYLSQHDKIGNDQLLDINYLNIDFGISVVKSDYIAPFTKDLKDLVATSQELYEDDYGNIRYYGANPNNYISLNNELWRIIGLINTKTESGEEEPLIKVIRAFSIGNLSFDYQKNNNYSNDYSESSLNKILNEEGYWNRTSVSCPNKNDRQATCDFTTTGLSDLTKKYLTKIVYYQGGWANNSLSPLMMYDNIHLPSQSHHTAFVTLMDPSDYGLAAGPTFNDVYLSSFNKTASRYNWLYNGDEEWLISPNTNDFKKAFRVLSDGLVDNQTNVNNAYAIRPVVYLNPTLLLDHGTGTSTDPYYLEFPENIVS